LVDEILTERSKQKFAYIDAEGLASHISIGSETAAKKSVANDNSKTGTSMKSKNTKNVKVSSNTNLN